MIVKRYSRERDEINLMDLIKGEGDEWSCYWEEEYSEKYRSALYNSITYVAYCNGELCGFSRSLDDNGFYIYVCDLLVSPKYRGRGIGKRLMECIYEDYPKYTVYVMSDVDDYYKKQSYKKEGSIFEVTKHHLNDQ